MDWPRKYCLIKNPEDQAKLCDLAFGHTGECRFTFIPLPIPELQDAIIKRSAKDLRDRIPQIALQILCAQSHKGLMPNEQDIRRAFLTAVSFIQIEKQMEEILLQSFPELKQ